MGEREDFEDLGPYPKAERNAELQECSIAAFYTSLPKDKFVW